MKKSPIVCKTCFLSLYSLLFFHTNFSIRLNVVNSFAVSPVSLNIIANPLLLVTAMFMIISLIF